MKNDDLKGFYAAIILSIGIIFLSNHFFGSKVVEQPKVDSSTVVSEELKAKDATSQNMALSSAEVLQQTPSIKIDSASVSGSISLKGARIDSLWLKRYKQTMSPESPLVELFSPAKTLKPYYASFGWLSSQKDIIVPDSNTVWSVKGDSLTPQTPVTLEWENGQGLKFISKISVDDNYMFSISQSVENGTNKSVSLYPYGFIGRVAEETGASVVHEGLIGVVDGKLEEIKYSKLEKSPKEFESKGGWLGFSDRYWFSAIILDSAQTSKVKFSQNENLYQADFVGSPLSIAAGSVGTANNLFYAGAKEIKLLDEYTSRYNIPKFDLAVDFGWYYFLTKPFFYILDFLYKMIGNMGWAILLFAVLLRLVMFPVANKSFENMAKMKKVQPKIKHLQEIYGQDKARMQQETLELYKKEKINPASGCLPMLIQIPVFFSLYKVLNISIELRHAPFIGWIKDLSAPDPLTISAWSHLPIPSFLDIGVWPIVMGITMFIQQKLNPAPANKDQARMFAMLPVVFTFMMGHFAAGLVIYWSLSNILSIVQQRAIIKKNEDK